MSVDPAANPPAIHPAMRGAVETMLRPYLAEREAKDAMIGEAIATMGTLLQSHASTLSRLATANEQVLIEFETRLACVERCLIALQPLLSAFSSQAIKDLATVSASAGASGSKE